MPQMSPLNWTFLFLFFLLMMVLMLNKIYFMNYPILKSKIDTTSNKNEIKWQW